MPKKDGSVADAATSVRIGGRLVGPGHPAYIIAEIGFNHGGEMELARTMIQAAAASGADAVKFQSYRADRLVLRGNPHFDVIRSGELSLDDHRHLAETAKGASVDFLSTPYDAERVGWLEDVGAPAMKIASMDLTNPALLTRAAESPRPVILSTGMATAEEIESALAVLDRARAAGVVLLHCMSEYPPDLAEARLATIPDLARRYARPVGYSDHVLGPAAAITAVALGACVIEKHFTTDHALPGPDHAISADPSELSALSAAIRETEAALGASALEGERPDRPNAPLFRRGVHAARDIAKGGAIHADDLKIVRPEGGAAPAEAAALVGRRARRPIGEEDPVGPDLLD